MRDRVKLVHSERVEVHGEHWTLCISVKWNAGGMNYYNGDRETKGYDLMAKAERIEGDLIVWSPTFPGFRQRLEGATRFNRNRMNKLADESVGQVAEMVERLKRDIETMINAENA